MKKVLLVCGLLFASSAFADDISVSAGTTYLNGKTEVFAVTYTHPLEHRFNLNLETSLMYIGESEQWNRAQPDKWTTLVRVTKKFGPIELGFGASYSSTTDDFNGSRLNFNEMLRYRFGEHWRIEIMHISNAGFVKPNLGRDIILVGYDF